MSRMMTAAGMDNDDDDDDVDDGDGAGDHKPYRRIRTKQTMTCSWGNKFRSNWAICNRTF